MSRVHVHGAALALLCTQLIQVSYAAVAAQSAGDPAPAARITLPERASSIDTVGEYHAWLGAVPGRTGDVWIVAGRAYAPGDADVRLTEPSAKPGSTIGAADRVFVRVQSLGGLWAEALAWIAALAVIAALISAASAIRFQRLAGQLRKELSELRGARGY